MRQWWFWLATTVISAMFLGCGDHQRFATAPAAPAPTTNVANDETHFLTMGDWGEDTAAQRQVAAAMVNYKKTDRNSLAALLLLGDNFYFQLTGVNDPRWQTVFEQVYDPKALDVPFYACLGNHDYDGNNLAIELAYSRQHPESRFKLAAEWYRIDLPRDRPMVTILLLDSNKDNLSDLQWHQQMEWLKAELTRPRATWTICCAHHPLFSNGFSASNAALQHEWGPMFQKYKVDFYLCGHEHDMEHLEIPGWSTSFLIAGGGGAHSHPLSRDDRGFSRQSYGFVSFDLTRDKAVVSYIGAGGQPMHVFERTKAGVVTVLKTTPNTPKTNLLKAYLEMRAKKP